MESRNDSMVRRQRRRPGENRVALLTAAITEFGRQGFHGASTSAIASQAQIPQPHVYVHFAAKSDLFVAALTHAYLMTDVAEDPSTAGDLSGHVGVSAQSESVEAARLAESLMHLQAIAAVGEPTMSGALREAIETRVRVRGRAWHRASLEQAASELLRFPRQ